MASRVTSLTRSSRMEQQMQPLCRATSVSPPDTCSASEASRCRHIHDAILVSSSQPLQRGVPTFPQPKRRCVGDCVVIVECAGVPSGLAACRRTSREVFPTYFMSGWSVGPCPCLLPEHAETHPQDSASPGSSDKPGALPWIRTCPCSCRVCVGTPRMTHVLHTLTHSQSPSRAHAHAHAHAHALASHG